MNKNLSSTCNTHCIFLLKKSTATWFPKFLVAKIVYLDILTPLKVLPMNSESSWNSFYPILFPRAEWNVLNQVVCILTIVIHYIENEHIWHKYPCNCMVIFTLHGVSKSYKINSDVTELRLQRHNGRFPNVLSNKISCILRFLDIKYKLSMTKQML